jgi:hypothetical protein
MKGIIVITAFIILMFGLNSCCSKSGTCSTASFNSFHLVNFASAEATDSVTLYIYKSKTNYTTVLDSLYLKGETTSDPNVFNVPTQDLSLGFDYGIYVVKLKKEYRLNTFTATKVTCGKCFLRSNNEFGEELAGYSVNGHSYNYSGAMNIYK